MPFTGLVFEKIDSIYLIRSHINGGVVIKLIFFLLAYIIEMEFFLIAEPCGETSITLDKNNNSISKLIAGKSLNSP
jgi:hypothetical protein